MWRGMQGIPSKDYTLIRPVMPTRTLTVALLATSTLLSAQTYKDPRSSLEVFEFAAPSVLSMNLYYHFSNFTADDSNAIFAVGSSCSLAGGSLASIMRCAFASSRIAYPTSRCRRSA